MLRIRLTVKNGGINKLLEQTEIPMIENTDELVILARVIGKMLSKYSEAINEPSILSALVDPSIEQWTIQDFESLDVVLAQNRLELFITSEDQILEKGDGNDILYLMIDNSYKELGIIPIAKFKLIDNKPEIIDLPGIVNYLLPEGIFREGKFYSNPIKAQLNNLEESKKLIGAYDNYTISKLYENLDILNKKLITIIVE